MVITVFKNKSDPVAHGQWGQDSKRLSNDVLAYRPRQFCEDQRPLLTFVRLSLNIFIENMIIKMELC